MKRLASVVMAAALALSLAGCATAFAGQNAPDAGSTSGSAQTAQLEPAADTVEEETPFPEYDPIPLDVDNPLADVDIASLEFRLCGVGEEELSDADAQVILDIAQNDGRVFVSADEGMPGYVIDENGKDSAGPRFYLTLESGQDLVLEAQHNEYATLFYIDHHSYELTEDEYESFEALYEDYYADMLDSAEDTICPYADLSADDLIKITRVNYYTFNYDGEYPMPEQVLTDEQAEMVIDTLRSLEIEVATANPKLDALFGGGYADFELWFKDGSHYKVGSYHKTELDEETYEVVESYDQAYIDSILYRCNDGFNNDLYWDYQETEEGYQPWYLNAREVAEYPFENLTADEIGIASMRDAGGWVKAVAPRALHDQIVDVLRQIRYCDENEVETDTFGGGMDEKTLYVTLTSGETFYLSLDGDEAVVNFGHYTQDPEVIDAIEGLFDDIYDARDESIDKIGETTRIAMKGSDTTQSVDPDTGELVPFTEYTYFELPSVLVEHEDGYYPEGYTLEDAPLSVQLSQHDLFGGSEGPDFYGQMEEEADAVDGAGYFMTYLNTGEGDKSLYLHWEDGKGVTEIITGAGYHTTTVVYIKGSDDYEITPEDVFALLLKTFETEEVY